MKNKLQYLIELKRFILFYKKGFAERVSGVLGGLNEKGYLVWVREKFILKLSKGSFVESC